MLFYNWILAGVHLSIETSMEIDQQWWCISLCCFSLLLLSLACGIITHTKLDRGRSIYTLLSERERERGRLTASLQRRTNEKEMPIANHRVLFYTTHFIRIQYIHTMAMVGVRCTCFTFPSSLASFGVLFWSFVRFELQLDCKSVCRAVRNAFDPSEYAANMTTTQCIYMQRGQINTCLYSVFSSSLDSFSPFAADLLIFFRDS